MSKLSLINMFLVVQNIGTTSEAESLYKQDPAKFANKGGISSINIDFNRPIGEGFIGNTKPNIKDNMVIGEYR